MYPVASAIKVVLHRAFRASAISRVTLANNFFKTSVLCACQGFPTCVCMCVCIHVSVCLGGLDRQYVLARVFRYIV